MSMKKHQSATIGELVVEFSRLTVASVNEINSARGLTKKTEKELDSIIEELVKRKVITKEQANKVRR